MSDVVVIGVAGGTGSGKTTVAEAIVARIGASRIAYLQHDSYYRDLAGWDQDALLHHNFDHPDALESELLAEHIRDLKAHHSDRGAVYDFTVHARTGRHSRRSSPAGSCSSRGS